MSPDDGSLRVTPEQAFHLFQISRRGAFLRKRDIQIAMQDGHQSHFGSEVEDPVEGRILQTGHLSRHLCGHKLLMNCELADACEYTRECLQNTPDVVSGIHVSRIKSGDHGIEPSPLLGRQRPVRHRNEGIGERIVVKRCIGVQIIGRCAVSVDAIGPLLLKRYAKQGDSSDLVAHDFHEILNGCPFLDVVRQMEVGVIQFKVGSLRLEQQRADRN